MNTVLINPDDFPGFEGQEIGRELELELTAVVTKVVDEGGIPSHVVMTIVRADITQTT